jgi:hypothetical protein
MSEIVYSPNALNVLHKFYRVEITVHVEGEDDVVFWQKIFELHAKSGIGFIPVGGSDELDRRIELIEDGTLDAIAARDSDYHMLRGKTSKCPKVIYSYGYSIENTLYSDTAVAEISKIACKTGDDLLTQTKNWTITFANSFNPLLKLDLANNIGNSGVFVLGDNCSRYMENNISHNPCIAKIGAKEIEVQALLEENSIVEANSIVTQDGFNSWRWLRGHFIASGVQKFISNTAKSFNRKVSVSHDHIFGQAILCLKEVLNNDDEQNKHYQNIILNALKNF